MSDKQIELLFKLQREANTPKPPEEVKVAAPVEEGRQVVEGKIVSVKVQDNGFDTRTVMTVKIQAEGGCWLTWGTLPSAISAANVGDSVRFTARLQVSPDNDYFTFFSRPSKASIVERAEVEETATA